MSERRRSAWRPGRRRVRGRAWRLARVLAVLPVLLLAAGGAPAPARAADEPLPAPFAPPARICDRCLALVIEISPDRAAGARVVAEALERRGYDVDRLAPQDMIALEAGVTRFVARLRETPGAQALIWAGAELSARDGAAGLSFGRPEAAAPAGLDALPLAGLLDQLAGSGARGAMLAVDAPHVPEGAVLPTPDLAVPAQETLVIQSLGGPWRAPDWAEAFARLIQDGLPPGADLADAMAALEPVSLSLAMGDVGAPSGARPMAPAGEAGLFGQLLDPGRLMAEQRTLAWSEVESSTDLADIESFRRDWCPGPEVPRECDAARRAGAAIRNQMDQAALECHALAGHPGDPRAVGGGAPDGRVDGRAAQLACARALEGAPEDGRLVYQYARALKALQNLEEYPRQLRRAAELGYAMAQFELANQLIARGGAPETLREAAELMRRAAEQGVADARLTYAAMLRDGTGMPADPEAMRRVLREASVQDPRARVMLAAELFEQARTDADLAEVERELTAALTQGLGADFRGWAEEMRAQVRASRQAMAEAKAPQTGLEQCQAALTYDLMEAVGLADLVDFSPSLMQALRRHWNQKLRRIDLDKVIEACDAPLVRTPDVAPSELLTRYGFLVRMMEDRGQTRRAFTPKSWITLYRAAAQRRDPEGLFLIGLEKLNADASRAEGMRDLDMAFDAGLSEAAIFLAAMHLNPSNAAPGFRPDAVLGLRYLRAIADQPIPLAKVLLGNLLTNPGQAGLPQSYADPEAGRALINEAIQLGVQ